MQFDGRGSVRNIIPRWRPVELSVKLGEVYSAEQQKQDASPGENRNEILKRTIEEFYKHRSAAYAAEVVALAIVEGVPEKARSAAELLARDNKNAALCERLIDRCLGRVSKDSTSTYLASNDIRAFRAAGPYAREDGFAWFNLALAYASCGQYLKAERALSVARGLVGGNNRLILRAEARLFQHMGDPERALATLRRDSNLLVADPWLMAPEIGLSQLVGEHSRFVRRARKLLDHGDSQPFQVSELAAAVATSEQAAGKHRLARKLFRLAVTDPAELGLAQTVWAAREVDNLIRVPDAKALKKSAEARARDAWAQLRWREAETACELWQQEESFATTPAIMLSSLRAAHLGDNEGAVEAANAGLLANPTHPGLLNNRAFALATLDRLDEAVSDLRRIKSEGTDQNTINRICTTATYGLIAFRRGHLEEGERLYRQAISMSYDKKNADLVALAAIFFMREAKRINLKHVVEDPSVLGAVFNKELHPSTRSLRKVTLERGLDRLVFRNRIGKPRVSDSQPPE